MAKHVREDKVTTDRNGDVTNMQGTITQASGDRPYAPSPQTSPKHAEKDEGQ